MSVNINSYFDKIIVINLDRHNKRLSSFMKQLENSVLFSLIQRYQGVDGSKIDVRILEPQLISKQALDKVKTKKQKIFGIDLTYGSLGCALSHILILKDCCCANKPFLVFEDDITFNKDIDQSLLETICNLPEKFDIVFLDLHNIPSLNKTIEYNDFLYIPQGLITGLFGMIISPEGARKILDKILPLYNQIDSEISKHQNHLNLYALKNPPISHSFIFGSSTQKEESCFSEVI